MISDTLVKIAKGDLITEEEKKELVDWASSAQDVPELLAEIFKGTNVIENLAKLSTDMGAVKAGTFSAGNDGDPEDSSGNNNFSGVQMKYPGLSVDGGTDEAAIFGMNAGVLSFWISALTGKIYAGAGSVTIDEEGIKTYNGVLNTGSWEADGDLSLGSDLSAPATTTFKIFTSAQTYNGESMGAGDILIGNNSASTPNVLYDASESQLQFRYGDNVNVYMDTDGTLKAGGGAVELNEDGIVLPDGGDGIVFEDDTNNMFSRISFSTYIDDNSSSLLFATYQVADQTNRISNGDFETGDFTSWTETDGAGYLSVTPTDRGYSALFGIGASYTQYISQALSSTATKGFIVTLKAKTSGALCTIKVDNGTPGAGETKEIKASDKWRTMSFICRSSSASVYIYCISVDDVYIDDVEVYALTGGASTTNLTKVEINSSDVTVKANEVALYGGYNNSGVIVGPHGTYIQSLILTQASQGGSSNVELTLDADNKSSAKLAVTGPIDIYGITMDNDSFDDGKFFVIQNPTAYDVTLKHESASATATYNRFHFPDNMDFVLRSGSACTLSYVYASPSTNSRWYLAGGERGIVSKVDQSGGTSDTYGILSGTINGSNTTFTVSAGAYTSGTLRVYLNGQLQTQGSAEDWTETTPASGTFDFITAPVSGDQITVTYGAEVVGIGASGIAITDSGGYFTGTDVEAAEQEIGAYAGMTDTRNLANRASLLITPTDLLNSEPSLSWATYTGFVTPTTSMSLPSIYSAYYSGGTASNTRMFGYLGSYYGSFMALVSLGIDNCRAGVRMDDGSQTNYIELYLQIETDGLESLYYRWSNGGVVTGPTALWSGLKFPANQFWLQLARSGNTVYLFAGGASPRMPNIGSVTFTSWTPARSGLYVEHPSGGSLDIQRAGMFDAIKYS